MFRNLNLQRLYFCGILCYESAALVWLDDEKLLTNSICKNCNGPVKLLRRIRDQDVSLTCNTCKSTTATLFMPLRLHDDIPVHLLLGTIYFWAIDRFGPEMVSYFLDFQVQPLDVLGITNVLTDLCRQSMRKHPTWIDGSTDGMVVEIGIKYLGNMERPVYVIGGVKRDEHKVFLQLLDHPVEIEVVATVERFVAKGSTLITDGFAFIDHFELLGYHRESEKNARGEGKGQAMVIHAVLRDFKGFLLNKQLRQNQVYDAYLMEYMWRTRFGREPGQAFFNVLKLLASNEE